MAQYKHLPIYRLTYELLQRIVVATKDYPREFKFTLGQKMKDESIELIVLIYRANSSDDKKSHIDAILERLQVVELLVRLSHDMRILPTKSYASIVEMTESLSKQASGWRKSTLKTK
ncbi:MAG: four helix bundle protein [Bacteriovoracaceae bacterium]|nr:four helix bundle protein [Bacteriovoracaceae bacterium]